TSEITGNGLKFAGVRVVRAGWASQIAKTPASPQLHRSGKKPGRPPTKPMISTAYRGLKVMGRIDFSKPMKVAIDQIKKRVVREFPEHNWGRGPSDETVRRVISADFRRSRNSGVFS